jgi:hypothetical protein
MVMPLIVCAGRRRFEEQFTVTLNKRQSPRRPFIWSPRFSGAGVRVAQTPHEVHNANTDAERPVRSIEEESLDPPIPPTSATCRRAVVDERVAARDLRLG